MMTYTPIPVHGFGYDPNSPVNSPRGFQIEIARALGVDFSECLDFTYFSAPVGLRFSPLSAPVKTIRSPFATVSNLFKSWGAGYAQPYRWAYKELASKAAPRLADMIRRAERPPLIVAHSLGTWVAAQAMAMADRKDCRAIFLNGAALRSDVIRLVNAHGKLGQDVLNIAVENDDVLNSLARRFSGRISVPIGMGPAFAQWIGIRHVVLDDPSVRQRALERRGWKLDGDNPDSLLDHFYSYRNPENWLMMRAYAAGDLLADLAV